MNTRHIYDLLSLENLLRDMISHMKFVIARLLIKHPKMALYSTATAMIMAVVCIFVLKPSPELNAQADHINNKYYTTITVESGDTLWDIAQEYRTVEYASVQDYIDEIKEINHITGDEITTGCFLTVPYYADAPVKE